MTLSQRQWTRRYVSLQLNGNSVMTTVDKLTHMLKLCINTTVFGHIVCSKALTHPLIICVTL